MTTQTLSRRGVMSKAWWIENKSLVALLVLIGVVSFLSPNFFTADNLLNILRQTSVNAIMAVGMTLVILTAGIDLSVGSMLALCGALAATMVAMEPPICWWSTYVGGRSPARQRQRPHHCQRQGAGIYRHPGHHDRPARRDHGLYRGAPHLHRF